MRTHPTPSRVHQLSLAVLVLASALWVPADASEVVTLAWDANPEADVAGYRLYCGSQPNRYEVITDVGKVTETQVSGLSHGETYYFALTAYNTSGIESLPTEDLVYSVAKEDAPPVATTVAVTGLEDTPIDVVLGGEDPEGAGLLFTLLAAPDLGTLIGTAPNLTYQPAPDFHGVVTFQYTVSDGTSVSQPATVTLTVLPVNDPPVALGGTLALAEDTSIAFSLAGSDADGDPLDYDIVTPPAFGVVSGTLPNLVFTPHADFHGSDSLHFVARDGDATSAPAILSFTVTPVNDPPTATALFASTVQGQSVVFTLQGTDPEGDALAFIIVKGPANGTLVGDSPDFAYHPAPGFSGIEVVEFVAHDGQAKSSPAEVRIEVTPAPDTPPLARDLAVTTTEDTPLAITLDAEDPEGKPVTYALATTPANGVLSGTPPNLVYTPKPDFNGTDEFAYTASDGTLTSAPARVTLVVTPVNDAPIAFALNLDVPGGCESLLPLKATDPDGDELTYIVVRQPRYGKVYGTPTQLWYRPNDNFNYRLNPSTGVDRLDIVVSDGQASSAAARIQLRTGYKPVIEAAPAPVDDTLVVLPGDEGTLLACGRSSVLGNDLAPDGSSLTAELREPPSSGSLVLEGCGSFAYRHDGSSTADDTFTYAAVNAEGYSNSARVRIHVLQILSLTPTERGNEIEFSVASGLNYAVETFVEAGDAAAWQVLTQFQGEVDGAAIVTDTSSVGLPERLYRIRCLNVPEDVVTDPVTVDLEALAATE